MTDSFIDFSEIEKAVDSLEKEIPRSALAAIRSLDQLKRVIQRWKDQNVDDGK